MNLHLGFEASSYTTSSNYVGRHSGVPYGEGKNSAQVAAELEERYGIVETFVRMEEDFIISIIEDKMGEDLDEIIGMSSISKKGISDQDTDKIVERFKRDIAHRRFDGLIPGVPTLASIRGVLHSRRHPYARRASRPSFRDTGNYVNSFRAWTED